MAIAQTAPGHWLPWGQFREALRTGKRQTSRALGDEIFHCYGKHPDEAGAFMGAMNDLSMLVAGELTRLVDLRRVDTVVDVGGAHGTLIAAVLGANLAAKGVLLELAHVAEGARQRLAGAGLGQRCEVVAGDFFENVPRADLYLLKQILHDWDDEQVVTILRNCARGLEPGGRGRGAGNPQWVPQPAGVSRCGVGGEGGFQWVADGSICQSPPVTKFSSGAPTTPAVCITCLRSADAVKARSWSSVWACR